MNEPAFLLAKPGSQSPPLTPVLVLRSLSVGRLAGAHTASAVRLNRALTAAAWLPWGHPWLSGGTWPLSLGLTSLSLTVAKVFGYLWLWLSYLFRN